MYAIIVGAGRVGTAMAHWLIEADQEVTVIERDARRCDALEDALGNVAVHGDATESTVLERAGAQRADALIATGRRDDENLVVCQMARHIYGVGRVISIINVSDHVDLFNRLGVNAPIDITLMMSEALQERLGDMLTEDIGGI